MGVWGVLGGGRKDAVKECDRVLRGRDPEGPLVSDRQAEAYPMRWDPLAHTELPVCPPFLLGGDIWLMRCLCPSRFP